MQSLHDDPTYEDLQTSHLYTALESAMQIQKKKVIVGPQDAVGILFFNTVCYFSFGILLSLYFFYSFFRFCCVWGKADEMEYALNRHAKTNAKEVQDQRSNKITTSTNTSLRLALPRFKS
jgi:hypothetical protein